ncbi:GNAT family N-acetyltransferase, partial [Loktanella sp. DJP18]
MALILRCNRDRDLIPLASMLRDADIPLLNPNAKVPFDEVEWHHKWLGDPEDISFYLQDASGRDVGFFALRQGVGPEVRHLTYVY